MLVVCGVDQLNVHSHPIANPAHAAFQNGSDAECFPYFANIGCLPSIWHDRGARNHFQVANFGQIRQHVILNAVRKIGILFFVAQIFKRQYRNRLINLARGDARQEKEAGGGGNGHAGCDKHNHIAPAVRPWQSRRRRLYALRGDIKSPCQDQCDRESGE